jgi:hypothetical protein
MEYQAIAEALGLDEDALYRLRWRERSKDLTPRRQRGARGLVAVHVAATVAAESIVVHGPLGLRVEGLTLEALAELLRRLS